MDKTSSSQDLLESELVRDGLLGCWLWRRDRLFFTDYDDSHLDFCFFFWVLKGYENPRLNTTSLLNIKVELSERSARRIKIPHIWYWAAFVVLVARVSYLTFLSKYENLTEFTDITDIFPKKLQKLHPLHSYFTLKSIICSL